MIMNTAETIAAGHARAVKISFAIRPLRVKDGAGTLPPWSCF